MAQYEKTSQKANETQLVILRLREEEFGAPINSVLEISRMLDITHIPEAPDFIEGVINLRGRVITVVDLARQFGMQERSELPKTARIVVVEAAGETIGLIVDEVPEVLRVADTNVEPTPEMIQSKVKQDYVRGVAKLDERLIMVLDLTKVLSQHQAEAVGKISEGNRAS